MADGYSHINYSIEDIERYLSGRMSAKEMHDIERAALGDPFLADAIEGYKEVNFDQAQQHLKEINSLLQKDNKQAKVIPIPVKKNNWLRIAAAFILLAGVGAVSWFLLKNGNSATDQQIAIQKKQPAKVVTDSSTIVAKAEEEKAAPPVVAQNNAAKDQSVKHKSTEKHREADKAREEKEEIASVTIPEKKAAGLSYKADSNVVDADAISPDRSSEALAYAPSASRQKAEIKNSQISNELKKASAAPANTFVLNGKVLDNNRLPVPNATVILNNTNAATVTDMQGNFSITSKDSVATVTVESLGYANNTVLLKANTSNKVTISESSTSLNETVVVGYGTKKNKKADSLASPVTGWDSFDKYVHQKLKTAYDSTSSLEDMNGDVMIEFAVDNNGKPYDFKVLQSLTDEADKTVIEIIRQGPVWTSDKKRKKGKVTVHF